MPKTKISEFSSTPANNTDIDSINIAENCPPSGINDAIRELMAQLKDWQSGTSNDPYVIGSSGSLTLNQGTANTVPYLNGSKVVTSGTALSFDGSNLGLGVTPSAGGASANYRLFEIGLDGGGSIYSGTNQTLIGTNIAWSGGTPNYKRTGSAPTLYNQQNGAHSWSYAASGTAGNAITFTQAMTLDASGNLGIGLTSPSARLHSEAGTGATNLRLSSATKSSVNIVAAREGVGYWPLDIDAERTQFLIQGVEKARIDSSGKLLVGTTTVPTGAFGADSLGVQSGGNTAIFKTTAGSGAGTALNCVRDANGIQIGFHQSGSYIGNITTNGTSTAYNTSSDYRLKNTITPMTGALAKVALLKPVTYKWNADNSDGQGFIAHELAEVCPDAVTGEKDGVETYTDEDGNEQTRPKYQGIDVSFLVATLTAALQEQQAIITSQSVAIEELKARLDAANL